MKSLNKCIAVLLVLPMIWLFMPRAAFCTGRVLYAKADNKTITQHEPKVMATPEKELAPGATVRDDKKKPNWLWIGLGAALLIGLVAAAGGGGGGDGGGNDPPPDEDNGDITVGW
jgi:hypothetical protein